MRDRLIIGVMAAALCASASAAPDSERSVRKALAPLYGKIQKAFMNRDIEGLLAVLAPPNTARPREKAADPMKLRREIGLQLAVLKKMIGAKMQITKVTVKGDRAVVLNSYSFSGLFEPQKGKVMKMADNGVTRDTWAKTPRGWRLLNLETVKSRPTLDGRPLKEVMAGDAARKGPRK
jgi:hypothetical protein